MAAKKHVLLADPQLPPAIVNAKTKPLSQELTKLTRRTRQFPRGAGLGAPGGRLGEEGEEEEGDLVTGPLEQCLKRMIKAVRRPPNHKSLLQDSVRVANRPPVKFPSRKGLLPPVEETSVISVLV